MFQWIAGNAGTILVTLLLAALVAGSIRQLRRDRRMGKNSCGSNCGCCPMSGSCHKSK